MSAILKALKDKKLRIDHEDKWLVWNQNEQEWEVWQKKRYARHSKIICITDDEERAVQNLLYA